MTLNTRTGRKIFRSLWVSLSKLEVTELFRIDTCSLHVVHDGYKTAHNAGGWEVLFTCGPCVTCLKTLLLDSLTSQMLHSCRHFLSVLFDKMCGKILQSYNKQFRCCPN